MRGWRGIALITFAVAGLSGCTTASLEDAAPLAATVEATLPEQITTIPTPTPVSGDAVAAIPDAGATAAADSVEATESAAVDAQGSARQTGQYPNLNIVPTAAAPQLTAAEKNAKLAELEAARRQAVGGASGKPVSNDAKLKKLARTHAEEALKQIEGQ
ncbi:hypothetical protein RHIZO_02970 [Rhizobiaceae bacterium]|nr:hypothetical protein RHIZO_02970 [Rhizobiaceae bacterium]